MTGYRLTKGGRIDRAEKLVFTFDGRTYWGHPGDTLASALLADGVRVAGRSFKYHRPRGFVTAGPEEPCALIEVGAGRERTPNVPATVVPLVDGLTARSQNRWPSRHLDLQAINGWVAPLLPAGFYYKTFMWPRAFWERVYEPLIRRAAGLGRIADGPDPAAYEHVHHHCDVLVVGAGAAGLAAARSASVAGHRVILAERDGELGGGLLMEPDRAAWLADAVQAVNGAASVLTRTDVVAAYDHGVFAALETVDGAIRQRLHIIRARRAIFATGATERLIAFPNNDRPGVMLASAARTYALRHGVAVGRRVVVFTTNDAAYQSARDLAACGIEIVAIVDPREDSAACEAARRDGFTVLSGHEVCDVSAGWRGVTGAVVRTLATGVTRHLATDVVCVSGGQSPLVALASQARVPLAWHEPLQAFVPNHAGTGLASAGAANGTFGIDAAIAEGEIAGRGEARAPGGLADGQTPPAPLWEVKGHGKAFVDLQHDVTTDDIRLAHLEGYSHVEHAKRYTTHGMGTDQGRIGGLTGTAVLAEASGRSVADVGLPTFRPYATPVTFGALAGPEVGHTFKPERRLPLHDWHAAHGAVFVRIGTWMRPLVYSPTGDTSWGAVLEEARAVRSNVGITDVSSLGKVDVQGPDAATFLDRIYTNTFSTLPVGRARYGLMLREDGILLDDGTTSRLGPDHFVVTTTTQKADDVLAHMEWHLATVWPDLDVTLTNVADQWAQFAVAGPRALDVVARVVSGRDLSDAAFPFMAAGEAIIAGVPGRIFRISFSGERAYELAVPAQHARPVWDALLAAGAPLGMRPYALDALNVLRIEKGHVTGGEINGQTTPGDLGLGGMLKKTGDFVGRVLGQRPGLRAPGRLQLVGIAPVEPGRRLRAGAHLVTRGEPNRSQGFVTAACMAAEGEGWIGLALLSDGQARHGETLVATSPVHGDSVEVRIESPHRVDPANTRVKGTDASAPDTPPLVADVDPSRAAVPLTEIAARRGQAAALGIWLNETHGLPVPGPGRFTEASGLSAVSLAPGRLLLIGAASIPPGGIAAAADQTGGFVRLSVSGPNARACLARLCRLDLDARAFPPGAAARTLMAQTTVLLLHRQDRYDILVPTTLAGSFAHALSTAAASTGAAVPSPFRSTDSQDHP